MGVWLERVAALVSQGGTVVGQGLLLLPDVQVDLLCAADPIVRPCLRSRLHPRQVPLPQTIEDCSNLTIGSAAPRRSTW